MTGASLWRGMDRRTGTCVSVHIGKTWRGEDRFGEFHFCVFVSGDEGGSLCFLGCFFFIDHSDKLFAAMPNNIIVTVVTNCSLEV